MAIKSIFVPDTCLQNDKFSAHVTWDKNHQYSILLKIPSEMKIEDLFNVKEREDFDNAILIKKTVVPGYVGFTFYSDSLDTPFHNSQLEFQIYENGEFIKSFVKEILFFRPEIEVVSIPNKIVISCNNNSQFFEVSDKIQITNHGQGTAQINVKIEDESNCRIIPLSCIDEFRIKFLETLNSELTALSSRFPEYSIDLNNFLELVNNPPSFDENTIKEVKRIITRIEEILENDEEFNEELVRAIAHAYFKNINPYASIEEFKKYIDSIEKNKIVMINSVDFFEFDKGITNLNVILERTDLALNDYSNINISPIKVVTNEKCKIPIHAFFNWGLE